MHSNNNLYLLPKEMVSLQPVILVVEDTVSLTLSSPSVMEDEVTASEEEDDEEVVREGGRGFDAVVVPVEKKMESSTDCISA